MNKEKRRARQLEGLPTKRKLIKKVGEEDTKSEMSMSETDGENE